VVLSLPRLHQHEEMAEEGGAGDHPHEHLAEVDEDGRLEDGVGREVLKLEPELLHQCRARLTGPCSDALDPGTMLRLEIFKYFLRRLHRLGADVACASWNCRIRSSSFFSFSSASSSCSASNLSRLSNISSLKARSFSRQARSVSRLSRDASFSLRFSSARAMFLALSSNSRSHFWILYGLHLLDPLGLQGLVQGLQLGSELCCKGLPFAQGLLPPGQFLLPLGCLQLPGIHLLEVPFVILVVPLKLGPLGGELAGRRLGALLQLGAPVTEALVFGLKHLPLPQYRRLSLMKSLMGMRQHPGEGNWRCFWLGAGPEHPPKNHLCLLRSGRRDGAGHAPASPSMTGVGAVGTSSAAANGVLDGIAVVEAAVAVGAVGTPSTAAMPLDIAAAAARPPAGAWEPGGTVSAAAAGGGGGTTLGAEGEEALTSKGWVKTCRHNR
jgi:hypothetical protein